MVKEGKLWLNCLNATMGNFMYGYNLGAFNPCQKNVSKTLNWENDENLLVLICTSLFPLGTWLGTLISARLAQNKGRRYSFIVACLIGIIGGTLSSVPFTYTFASGRFVSGFSAGIFLSIVPLYINEVVPLYLKSEIGVLSGLLIGIGLAVSLSFGLIIPNDTESSYNEIWIFMFAFQSLVFFIQLILFLFVFKHDTPQFYRKVRKYQEAEAFLKRYEMEEEFPKLHESEVDLKEKGLAYKELCIPENRKQFRINIALSSLEQLCGANLFSFYSMQVFRDILDGEFMAKIMTLSIGLCEVFTQILVLLIVNKFGRRTLILWGVFLMMVSFALTGVLIFFELGPSWIIFVPYFFYDYGFSMSTGITIYIYAGETLEEKAISIVTGLSRFLLIVIALVSPELIFFLGIPYTLGIFTLIIFLYFVYLCFDIVETKGLTREQIKQLFASGKYN